MLDSMLIALVPLIAMALGVLIGLAAGWSLTGRALIWLLAGSGVLVLVLILWLASVQPDNETDAFVPLAMLTGGVFPALFGGIMGVFGGRALRKRRGR